MSTHQSNQLFDGRIYQPDEGTEPFQSICIASFMRFPDPGLRQRPISPGTPHTPFSFIKLTADPPDRGDGGYLSGGEDDRREGMFIIYHPNQMEYFIGIPQNMRGI